MSIVYHADSPSTPASFTYSVGTMKLQILLSMIILTALTASTTVYAQVIPELPDDDDLKTLLTPYKDAHNGMHQAVRGFVQQTQDPRSSADYYFTFDSHRVTVYDINADFVEYAKSLVKEGKSDKATLLKSQLGGYLRYYTDQRNAWMREWEQKDHWAVFTYKLFWVEYKYLHANLESALSRM